MDDRPVCFGCKEPIYDPTLWSVEENHYHKQCLVCKDCQVRLERDCAVNGADTYCGDCYLRRFTVQCTRCQEPIMAEDRAQTLGDFTYHATCFACVQCGSAFNIGTEYFANHETGGLLCKYDYMRGLNLANSKSPAKSVGEIVKLEKPMKQNLRVAASSEPTHNPHQPSPPPPPPPPPPGAAALKVDYNPQSDHRRNHPFEETQRRKRTTIDKLQKRELIDYFGTQPAPSRVEIVKLSRRLALPVRVVKIWFQNQRAKQKQRHGSGAVESNS